MSKHNWSTYQKTIFKEIAEGSGNVIIIARAGSAKTSSLVEGAKYIPRNKSGLYCAFNKSIQLELKDRLGDYVECFTLHSLALKALKQKFVKLEIDQDKAIKIIQSLVGKNTELNDNLLKTVSLAKATLNDSPSQIDDLIDDYDVNICDLDRKEFSNLVIQILKKCKEDTKTIDFDDMIWFCFVHGVSPAKYDYVFVDEAQDMNRAMIELALSAKKPDGRVICVLDNYQAIYGFRGADSQVLDNLRKRLKPKELSLPICYRCPKRVVYLAQKLVPDIKSYENAIDGEIVHINNKDLEKYVTPGCFVLSRTNAPLVFTCMQFIKKGIKANILGRDIGNNLSWIIKKSGKKNVGSFLVWLDKWAETETLALAKKGKKNYSILDKVECLQILCQNCKSIEEVQESIKKMFEDTDDNIVILFSSIHKSKGLERDNVFILYDTIRNDSQENKNINYVAFTRCRKKLYLVSKNN